MSTKIMFLILIVALSLSCQQNRQPKIETLWDEKNLPKFVEEEEEKVHLRMLITPPIPMQTDKKDTATVINPEKMSKSDKIFTLLEIDYLAHYRKSDWKTYREGIEAIAFPKRVKQHPIPTYLYVFFVVEKDGSTSNFKFETQEKGASRHTVEFKGGDDEIIMKEIQKYIEEHPYWIPSKKDNEYVRSRYNIGIYFIEKENDMFD